MDGAEAYFQKYGIVSLLVGRFIGPLRPMLPMVAGMCDMPFRASPPLACWPPPAGQSPICCRAGPPARRFEFAAARRVLAQAGVVAACLAVLFGIALNSTLRGHRRATLWMGCASLALLIAMFIGYPYLNHFDQGLMALVQEHRGPAMDRIMVMTTQLGEFKKMFVASAVLTSLLLLARQWRQAIFVGATLLQAALINTGSKLFFARGRPEILVDPLTSQHAQRSRLWLVCVLPRAGGAGRSRPTDPHAPGMAAIGRHSGRCHCVVAGVSGGPLAERYPRRHLAGHDGLRLQPDLEQRHSLLPPMAPKVWWLIVPGCVAVLGFFALTGTSHALLRYAY